ncbi:MAG: helix-turn-helix domain-containing protein [Propionibacteriaceae bacterium]|jgi:hypothetical protein|nr:helix-turn-helix domain-containing protein [Propionibacteriaceae bacterium]
MAKTQQRPSTERAVRSLAREDAAAFASPSVSDVLAAIHDSATDLAQNRDPDIVAHSIVQRTRHLLAADMAYISLNDLSAGETFIRWTSGVRTEAYRTIRMPLGTGVLGMIAAGQPVAYTNQYLADPVMIHVADIDEIVAAEGVFTVTGVPIRISGRVVGALLVANRTPMVLTSKGQFALEQMAAQAAIVLIQQQAGEDVRQLRTMLDADVRNSTAMAEDMARALKLDERLLELLIRDGDTVDMVVALQELLGQPLSLWSPSGRLLAGTPQPGIARGEVFQWRVNGAAQASLGAREPALLRLDDSDLAVMGIEVEGHHFGTLAMVGEASPAKLSDLRRGAALVTASMAVQNAIVQADERAGSALVEDLMSVRTGRRPDALPRRLAQHGLSGNRFVAALCVPAEKSIWPRVLRTIAETRGNSKGLVSPHQDHVCALIAADEPRALGERLAAALKSSGCPAIVGLSVAEDTVAETLALSHDEALATARAAAVLRLREGVFDAASLGIAGVLVGGADPGFVEQVVDRFLGQILAYDDAHGTQLAETARQFFENSCQLGPTAAQLHVHFNTVKQRLERIDKLQDPGWRNGPHAVDTHFALRLWHARSVLATRN